MDQRTRERAKGKIQKNRRELRGMRRKKREGKERHQKCSRHTHTQIETDIHIHKENERQINTETGIVTARDKN